MKDSRYGPNNRPTTRPPDSWPSRPLKRFCFDLDGTLCESKGVGQEYKDVAPIEHICELVRRCYKQGHYVIIYTARNMVTFDGNIGKIIRHQVPVIQEWLERHNVPYHELIVGKPHADYFIDDKAVNPLQGNSLDIIEQWLTA